MCQKFYNHLFLNLVISRGGNEPNKMYCYIKIITGFEPKINIFKNNCFYKEFIYI